MRVVSQRFVDNVAERYGIARDTARIQLFARPELLRAALEHFEHAQAQMALIAHSSFY